MRAARRREDGEEGVSARVYPALVHRSHPLAAVHGANNAVFVEAEAAGSLMFYGAGAGGIETASAVLGDVVSAARRHVVGGPGLVTSASSGLPVLPIGHVTTRYQVTLEVLDRPGVLAQIAGVFADHGVSVETLVQTPPVADPLDDAAAGAERREPTATLVIGTHAAAESDLAATVTALHSHGFVGAVTSVLRVEGA
ncbi:ACT domain-containing protein [Rathayibacter oskolensis]|nr:ACT domain-containing protein [Rathayibacter oskolensis]WKK73315.1 ACT domain-containing protein [Rathayibacter oskolensis]